MQTHSEMLSASLLFQDETMRVLLSPNEQLSEAPLDGTVGVRALADVRDVVDGCLQGIAFGIQVTQLLHQFDFVTVVQRS